MSCLPIEGGPALGAEEGLLTGMDYRVDLEVMVRLEPFLADGAYVGCRGPVDEQVSPEIALTGEHLLAHRAWVVVAARCLVVSQRFWG